MNPRLFSTLLRASPFRIGAVIGGIAGAGFVGFLVVIGGRVPFDFFVLGLLAMIVICAVVVGSILGGAIVSAVGEVRRSPIVLVKAAAFLAVVSVLALAPHGVDEVRARTFLAQADSARGIVTSTYQRGGKHIFVSYVIRDRSGIVRDKARWNTAALEKGDSAWVFADSQSPFLARVGRPGPDWSGATRSLIPLWAIGGILFLGFGASPVPAGIPESGRTSLRWLRAFAAAGVICGLGITWWWVGESDLHDPRWEVVEEFHSFLVFGMIVGFMYAAFLGGLALYFLRARRWTNGFAYAGCGAAFGLLGGLPFGSSAMLVGSVCGVFACLLLRWYLTWGGELLGWSAATTQPALQAGDATTS